MARFSLRFRTLIGTVLSYVAVSATVMAQGPPPADGGDRSMGASPSYQRHAFDGQRRDDRRDRRDFRRSFAYPMSPQISAGWFQRPYPYHLDYYRMRYGGSYAPYFGNLYGPPQAVYYPPYYGPYYTGYGSPNPSEYGQNYGGLPGQYPPGAGALMPPGALEQTIPTDKSTDQSTVNSNSGTLPMPSH